MAVLRSWSKLGVVMLWWWWLWNRERTRIELQYALPTVGGVRSGQVGRYMYCPGRDSSSLYWTKYLHTSPPVGVELTRWPVRRDALVKGNNPI